MGALPGVLAALKQTRHLRVMGNKRQLITTGRLLDDWALTYARTLRPKQLLRTLVAPTFETRRTWDVERMVANVLDDDLNVNAELVRQGHARAYRQYLTRDNAELCSLSYKHANAVRRWTQPSDEWPNIFVISHEHFSLGVMGRARRRSLRSDRSGSVGPDFLL